MKNGLRVKWTETWHTPLRKHELNGLYDEAETLAVFPTLEEAEAAMKLMALEPMGHA